MATRTPTEGGKNKKHKKERYSTPFAFMSNCPEVSGNSASHEIPKQVQYDASIKLNGY